MRFFISLFIIFNFFILPAYSMKTPKAFKELPTMAPLPTMKSMPTFKNFNERPTIKSVNPPDFPTKPSIKLNARPTFTPLIKFTSIPTKKPTVPAKPTATFTLKPTSTLKPTFTPEPTFTPHKPKITPTKAADKPEKKLTQSPVKKVTENPTIKSTSVTTGSSINTSPSGIEPSVIEEPSFTPEALPSPEITFSPTPEEASGKNNNLNKIPKEFYIGAVVMIVVPLIIYFMGKKKS